MAAVGPVHGGVDGARVAGVVADAGELAVLDRVVVAGVAQPAVGAVVDQAVRDAQADAGETDGRVVGRLDAADVVDVAVLDGMAAGREGLAVAAFQRSCRRRPVRTGRNCAPRVLAALDPDRRVGKVAEGTASDRDLLAAGNGDPRRRARPPASGHKAAGGSR